MSSQGLSWSPWWPATQKVRDALMDRANALGHPTRFPEVQAAVTRAVRCLDIEKPTEDILLAIIATIQKEDLR